MYYGQRGQDSLVRQFFAAKGVTNGTFLDVGAVDGIHFSNTYLLETQDNWTGVCIEMHPSYNVLLPENRPNSVVYKCAVGAKDSGKVMASLNWRGGFSTLDVSLEPKFKKSARQHYGARNKQEIRGFLNGRHKVPVRTLDSILAEQRDRFPRFDFVTVDIDGSEKYALPHFNVAAVTPTLMCLEWGDIGKEDCIRFAKKAGLAPAREIDVDLMFVVPDDVSLLKSLHVQGSRVKVPLPCGPLL